MKKILDIRYWILEQIHRYQSSKLKYLPARRDGFTLVELLTVIFIFVVLGGILAAIITSTLRGNNKTNAINAITSNGDYAIIQITKAIRSATTLLVPYPCGTLSSPTSTSSVKLRFTDSSMSTYSCLDTNNNPSITSNSAALIDINSVKVAKCNFTCAQSSPSDYPIINVDFSLKSNTTSNLLEQQASSSAIEFQTSVVGRNMIR